MTRLKILLEKRTELINQLIELKTFAANSSNVKVDVTIANLEERLDELQERIERLRMDS